MKHRIITLFLFLFTVVLTIGAQGAGSICKYCRIPDKECPYGGTQKHPTCKTCGKVIVKKKYGHRDECEYQGNHPKCATCGKVKEKCEYRGNHPKCDVCGKVKEQCDYAGNHPVCVTCGKLKERCEYGGSHPLCTTCGKLKEKCEYNGNHPKCTTCGKLKEQCEYRGNHPVVIADRSFTVNGVTFKMIGVQGGTFTMGATSEQGNYAHDEEKPAHSVTLSSFSIGETEVTQALWEAVMGSNPSSFKGPQKPVEQVSWNDCQTFISKLNSLTGQHFRLPTEAEWEYASRGGNKSRGYQFSGSNTLNNEAWYAYNSGHTTHDVKTKSPNELGIYDMSGNVWEWCQDWYGIYGSSSQTNPTGDSSGSNRVYRGGSWYYDSGSCRVSYRCFITPTSTSYDLGLRLVL